MEVANAIRLLHMKKNRIIKPPMMARKMPDRRAPSGEAKQRGLDEQRPGRTGNKGYRGKGEE